MRYIDTNGNTNPFAKASQDYMYGRNKDKLVTIITNNQIQAEMTVSAAVSALLFGGKGL